MENVTFKTQELTRTASKKENEMDQELGRRTALLAHHIETFHRQLEEMRDVWSKTIKTGDVVRFHGAPVVVGDKSTTHSWMWSVTYRDAATSKDEQRRQEPMSADPGNLWPWTSDDDAAKAILRQYTMARLKIEAKIFAGDKLLLSQIEALVAAEPDQPVSDLPPPRTW